MNDMDYTRKTIAGFLFGGAMVVSAALPFVTAQFFFQPFITPRIILWALAVLLFGAAAIVCFEKKTLTQLAEGFGQPIIFLYGGLVLWLIIRTAFVWRDTSWWGTWERTDGLWMLLSWLFVLLCVRALRRVYPQIFKIGILVFILTALVSTLAVDVFGWGGDLFDRGRWSGSVGNAIYFSSLIIFFPWAVFEFLQGSRWPKKIRTTIFIISLGLAGGAIILSQTRGAMVAIVGAALVGVFELLRKRKHLIIILSIGLLVIVGGVGYGISKKLDTLNQNATIKTRLVLWRAAALELQRHPLIGFGFGAHVDVIQKHAADVINIIYVESVVDSSHSVYIDRALQGGGIALILLVLWFIFVYRGLIGVVTRATFAGYAAVLATSFYDPWSAIPLLFLIVTANDIVLKPKIIIGLRRWGKFFVVGSGVIVGSSALLIIFLTPKPATALINPQERFIFTPNDNFPFAHSQDVQLVRGLAQAAYATPTELFSEKLPAMARAINTCNRKDLFAYEDMVCAVLATNISDTQNAPKEIWLKRAEEWELRALAKSPNRPQSVVQLANIFLMQGRGEEALKQVMQVSATYPNIADLHFYAAITADAIGKTDVARQEIKKALRFGFDNWSPEKKAWLADFETRTGLLN